MNIVRVKIEKYEGTQITDDMLREAAELFSGHYGTWGHADQVKPASKRGQYFAPDSIP